MRRAALHSEGIAHVRRDNQRGRSWARKGAVVSERCLEEAWGECIKRCGLRESGARRGLDADSDRRWSNPEIRYLERPRNNRIPCNSRELLEHARAETGFHQSISMDDHSKSHRYEFLSKGEALAAPSRVSSFAAERAFMQICDTLIIISARFLTSSAKLLLLPAGRRVLYVVIPGLFFAHFKQTHSGCLQHLEEGFNAKISFVYPSTHSCFL